MRRRRLSVVIVLAVLSMAPSAAQATASRPSPEARTALYLDTIRTRPAKLRAFLKAMPKGADLHKPFVRRGARGDSHRLRGH